MTEPNREAAYAALVDALIALRRDQATERFDEYLDHARETGRIDEPTARALRWWQRASIRGLEEHLEGLLPGVLGQLERADQAAAAAVEMSDRAWRAAAGQPGNTDPAPGDDQPTTELESVVPEPEATEPGPSDGESVPLVGAPEHRTLTAGLTVLVEE